MRNQRAAGTRRVVFALFLTLICASCVVNPQRVHAQQIDQCNSEWVQGIVGAHSVYVTPCFVGSYSDDDAQGDVELLSADPEHYPEVGGEAKLYRGSTLLYDTGNEQNTDFLQTEMFTGITGDTYTLKVTADICYDSSGTGNTQNCVWYDDFEDITVTESLTWTPPQSCITFTPTGGSVSISTSKPDSTIFYTVDGSFATEASIEYSSPITPPSGTTVINAVAVQTSNGTDSAVIHQNEQDVWGNWQTAVSCVPGGSCESSYACTPRPAQGQGVSGTPADVYFSTSKSPSCYTPPGSSTTANLNFVSGTTATSVLWPYDVSSGAKGSAAGCETCTALVEDYYVWPEYDSISGNVANPSDVAAWESDLIAWNATSGAEAGASLQCNTSVGWQYDYQGSSPWITLPGPITQDCKGNLPFGTLPSDISSTATSFSVTPNGSNTIEAGMILRFGDGTGEEILCTAATGNECTTAVRGWGNTTAVAHSAGEPWMGSVHVQYHVSLYPGNGECSLNSSAVDCAFIDYLYINNVQHGFSQQSGYTHPGVPVPIPTDTPSDDRVFNQFQLDVNVSSGPDVGEYLDEVNVTGSWGTECSASYVVQ